MSRADRGCMAAASATINKAAPALTSGLRVGDEADAARVPLLHQRPRSLEHVLRLPLLQVEGLQPGGGADRRVGPRDARLERPGGAQPEEQQESAGRDPHGGVGGVGWAADSVDGAGGGGGGALKT